MAWSPQDSLAEVEEKYKRAMVSNAQLDNEKTNFMYQVDTLKEVLLELEEQLAEARRQHEEQSRVSFGATARGAHAHVDRDRQRGGKQRAVRVESGCIYSTCQNSGM